MGLFVLFAVAAVIVCAVVSGVLVYAMLNPPRKTFAVAVAKGGATDPADLGWSAEPITFSLTGGSSSPGWIIDGLEPSGPTILVVHGFGDSRFGALTWTPLLIPLARRVVVFDLRGHGDSEARYCQQGGVETVDLIGVLDQLNGSSEPADGQVVLFGYSMGAVIAIAAAAAAPDRVAAVVAEGVYRHWQEPVRRLMRSKRLPVQPFLAIAGGVLRLAIRGQSDFDRVEHASRLRCPLLVLHGADDRLCPLESARAIAAAAPNGRLEVFEGGGHLDLATVDSDRYTQVLGKLLAGVCQAGFSQQVGASSTAVAAKLARFG